jgi:mono/diheme cytochrome c family protein
MSFKQDRLENEKKDPKEASSLKFINVPIILLAAFVGFGTTYLALRTKNTSMSPGDSRTVVSNSATNAPPATANANSFESLMQRGKQVFTTTCQACHQANGQGVPGAFPPLAESEWVNGPAEQVAAIVLHGLQGEVTVKGQKFQNAMPSFKEQLKPEDIAAVGTYVRNSFGNKSEPMSVEMVNAVKEKTKDRTAPWNGEAELKAQVWK